MKHNSGRFFFFLPLLALCATPSEAATPGLQKLGAGIAHVSVSPDGSRLVFQKKTVSGWRIYTSRFDGSGQKSISAGPRDDIEPSWRSDGAAIAFASNRGGNYDLFSVQPTGTGLRQLTRTKIDERSPQWSPRAFGLFRPGDISTHTVVGRSTVNVAPGDLKLLQMLAGSSTEWDLYRAKFTTEALARYHKLLFVEGSGERRQIVTMRDNGSYRQTLATGMPGAHFNPSWERTATAIAFSRRVAGGSALYQADYPNTADRDADGGKPKYGIDLHEWRASIRRLGVVSSDEAPAQWTPNGEYLAVATPRGLQLLPRGGSGLKPFKVSLVMAPSSPSALSWMPDAKTALVSFGTGTTARAHTFTLSNPLLDVVNIRDFSESLQAGDRPYLERNSFVAAGRPRRQMFHAYEETDYQDLPIFITTDSLLHLNHLVFDYLLRGVETDHLMTEIVALSQHYLATSLAQRANATSPAVKQAAEANAAFFAVAARLTLGDVKTGAIEDAGATNNDPLEGDRALLRKRSMEAQRARLQRLTAPLRGALAALPPEVKSMADDEIALIVAHGGMASSPIFGGQLTGVGDPASPLLDTRIDYSDFIPRGHYTRSEILRRYFLATRWLSGGPFRPTPDGARRSLLIMAATDAAAQKRLSRVLKVMSVFVGDADDADMASYTPIARAVYGTLPSLAALADDGKIADFVERVKGLPQPRIAASRGLAFRFLPQPYTLDAEIMQNLTYDRHPPDVGTEDQPRYFALGLDVMGVLGSERARKILDNTQFGGTFFNLGLKETQYANYDAQFNAQRARFRSLTDAEWNSNLYTRTLHSLLPLLQPQPKNRYKFTQSAAWTDKNLNTALATWAELKHDTMPKMPVAIEAGSEGGISEAPLWEQPRGFVEPAPEVFRRLSGLVAAERAALAAAGYLSADTKQRLDTFTALLSMVTNLEKKQSSGQVLTPREIEQLRFYGAYQEHLTFVTAEGEGGSMEGNDMAIVADVASAYSTRLNKQLVLQEGVGRALPIYVAVERNGRRELTRGAVFTYYEFTQPAEQRLTDEKWRELLDSSNVPAPPAWTSSFISRTTGDD